ncbi:hypothetical protein [Aliiroseovarius sp. PrR006]|uniref:hypothetical protein n=1 Tax=Aliiroseovarius sp. PrR006 TaxID=2706883 RepID=UPI0013D6F6A5|nr:hypothetical protein [Aliiroseovarius sp. PrR006]NDW54017.1 hypothetical protein [Aliiroseovarius sp. PrR006]
MEKVWPWRESARFDAFEIVTDMSNKLRHSTAFGNEVATLMTDSFEGFPLLVLTDQDGNEQADFYAYYDEQRQKTTLEFGVFFTDPESNAPYWLVFNSGPAFDNSDPGNLTVYWVNYQFVDRNRDGRFDTYAVNNVDFDGDGRGSKSDVLWLFDENFDGGLDRGEHIIDGVSHDIPIVEGELQTRRLGEHAYEQKFHVGDPIGVLADVISADIQNTLTKGRTTGNPPAVPYLSSYTFPNKADDLVGWQDYQLENLKLRLPTGDGWSNELSENALSAVGGRRFDGAGALLTADAIIVAKDTMMNPIFGDWVIEELATRYREWEIHNMQVEGVDYSLGNVQMGDTVIGEHTFHFLTHFHLYDPPLGNGITRVRQELHLVFPPDFAKSHVFYQIFLMRYCLQEQCDNDELEVSYLRQVLGQISF